MHTDVYSIISKYKVHVTLKENLATILFTLLLLKHLLHCTLPNVDSQIIHWQIYANLNTIGEVDKKYNRGKLKKWVEKA